MKLGAASALRRGVRRNQPERGLDHEHVPFTHCGGAEPGRRMHPPAGCLQPVQLDSANLARSSLNDEANRAERETPHSTPPQTVTSTRVQSESVLQGSAAYFCIMTPSPT
jgi:hypothetical protein